MNASVPRCDDAPIDGIKRLQTDAATITPPAKPFSARVAPSLIPRRIKKTQHAPRHVPIKGIKIPRIISKLKIFTSQAATATILFTRVEFCHKRKAIIAMAFLL